MMKQSLLDIFNAIGGNRVTIALGCQIALDPSIDSCVLSFIKATRKCQHIKIINQNTTPPTVEVSFYKVKSFSLTLLNRSIVPLEQLRNTISEFTSIDI